MIQYNEIEETRKFKVPKSITCVCCGKKIKYNQTELNYLTNCPNNQLDRDNTIIKVGSFNCALCKYNRECRFKFVECIYPNKVEKK